jgi:hypothetical protein
LFGYNVFDPPVHPCIIICCRLDSTYICWSIYTILWEVVRNSKNMDEIDFQKNLSRGSLFWEIDLVRFLICCPLYGSFICWLIYMKLWEVVSKSKEAWVGLLLRKICQGDNFYRRGI